MTSQPEVVRQSDLINQLVLDRRTLEELGRLEVLWVYPQMHRVLGFISKSGFLGGKKAAFKLAQIHALGSNGILTRDQPEATTAEKVRQIESLVGLEVWSDTGNKIGKITDCLFNLKTGDITQYLFVSNGWAGITGEVYQLPPKQILSFGKQRVLVSEHASSRFALYQEGLTQKLTKAGELLKEEGRSIAQQAEAATEQAKGRLQSLTERARERAQRISQQARETAQILNEQLREETQTLVERARETSQTIADQVKERTEVLSKQVEEGIQTLTVQAEEIFDSVNEASDSDTQTSQSPDLDDLEWDIDDAPLNPNDSLRAAPRANRSSETKPPSPPPADPDLLTDEEPWFNPAIADTTVHTNDATDDDEPWLDLPDTLEPDASDFKADQKRPVQPVNLVASEEDDDDPWI